jgi:hypothetical protein
VAAATIVKSWSEDGFACLAVRVTESAPRGNVEYVGRLAITPAFQALTTAQQKAALVVACTTSRDAGVRAAAVDLGHTGAVTV